MSTHAPPFVRRGLLTLAAVVILLIGGASAIAQTDEEETSSNIVVTESAPPNLTLAPPLPSGDMTSEGTLLIDAPTNPVAIGPAPTPVCPTCANIVELPDGTVIIRPALTPTTNFTEPTPTPAIPSHPSQGVFVCPASVDCNPFD